MVGTPCKMVGTSQGDMSILSSRLESFVEWPSQHPVKPKHLAEAGFYYVGNKDHADDEVCCFTCGGTLSGWKSGDKPEEIHRQRFGDKCGFAQGRDVVESGSSGSQPKVQYDPIGDEDMENEQQRLRSFQRNNGWSGAVPAQKLAMAGFYFTGVDDNVKCFVCDLSLRQWEPEDDPKTEHLKYKPTCPFLAPSKASSERKPYATTGGFMPGMPGEVLHHHRENYTETVTIIGNESLPSYEPTSGAPMTYRPLPGTLNVPYQPKPDPGQHAANYGSGHTRLHTFINWPKECPVQPKELIDAGFYYTGEDDKASCFKCGVTLAGWEPEDTPWGEHEKWSRECPLVQERLIQRNPHGASSTTGGASILPKEQTCYSPKASFVGEPVSPHQKTCADEQELPGETLKEGQLPSEQSETPPCHMKYDSQDKSTKGNVKHEVFFLQKAVHELVDRGYNYGTIQETIQYKTKVCKETIDSLEELRNAVVLFMGDNQGPNSSTGQTDETDKSTEQLDSEAGLGFSLSVDPEALHRQVEKMQEAHTCKICLDAEIGVLFLPCGHLVCCPSCASEIQLKSPPICPVCRKRIENTIRTYLP